LEKNKKKLGKREIWQQNFGRKNFEYDSKKKFEQNFSLKKKHRTKKTWKKWRANIIDITKKEKKNKMAAAAVQSLSSAAMVRSLPEAAPHSCGDSIRRSSSGPRAARRTNRRSPGRRTSRIGGPPSLPAQRQEKTHHGCLHSSQGCKSAPEEKKRKEKDERGKKERRSRNE